MANIIGTTCVNHNYTIWGYYYHIYLTKWGNWGSENTWLVWLEACARSQSGNQTLVWKPLYCCLCLPFSSETGGVTDREGPWDGERGLLVAARENVLGRRRLFALYLVQWDNEKTRKQFAPLQVGTREKGFYYVCGGSGWRGMRRWTLGADVIWFNHVCEWRPSVFEVWTW